MAKDNRQDHYSIQKYKNTFITVYRTHYNQCNNYNTVKIILSMNTWKQDWKIYITLITILICYGS